MQKGITVLSTWEHPLRTEADVDVVGVGKKTRDKILEIMETGRLERNAMRAADPTWQVFMLQARQLCSFQRILQQSNALKLWCCPQAKQLFASVWGCGDIVAERWYLEGCRTLDDVRKCSDLTMQQQVGHVHQALSAAQHQFNWP